MMNQHAAVGMANSTILGYKAAILCFNAFQESRSCPKLEDLTPTDLADDGLRYICMAFANYLVTGDVRNRRTKNQEEASPVVPDTRALYLGKVKEALKAKSAGHPDWTKEDEWYKELYNSVKRGSARSYMQNPETFTSQTMPFYPEIKNEFVAAKARELILHGDKKYAVDLRTLCLLLLGKCLDKSYHGTNKSDPLQQRVWFIVLMLAIGRAGELKYLRVDEAQWDSNFENLDMTWAEPKTLLYHPMLFGPAAKNNYAADFYHAFACFALVERGLWRSPLHGAKSHKSFFPDLHNLSDGSIAAKITKILKENVNPNVKDFYSSKSARKGAATFLQHCADVTDAELNIRGGWSDSTNSRSYRVTTPALTHPGDAALNLWDNVRAYTYAPQLEAVGGQYSHLLEPLVDSLYMNSLPEFGPEGVLRPFLYVCTAALIMYHPQLVADFGTQHPVARQLIVAFKDLVGADTGIITLAQWAESIKLHFHSRNPDLRDPNEATILEVLRQQNQLLHRVSEQTARGNGLGREQGAQLTQVQCDVAVVKDAMCNVGQCANKDSFQHQPSLQAPTGIPARVSLDNMSGADEPTFLSESGKRIRVAVTTLPLSKQAKMLVKSSSGLDGAKGAGVRISAILDKLYKEGRLKGNKSALPLDIPGMAEPSKLRLTMELVRHAMTDALWQQLLQKGLNDNELAAVTVTIEGLCLDKLRELCVRYGSEKAPMDKSRERASGKYMGVGARVLKLKNTTRKETLAEIDRPETTGPKLTGYFKVLDTNNEAGG